MLGSKTYIWRVAYEDGQVCEYTSGTILGACLHSIASGGVPVVSIVRMEEVDMDAIPVVDEKKLSFRHDALTPSKTGVICSS